MSVDGDFAAYVDARQARWVRGAQLVCADRDRAVGAVRYALTRLALRWSRTDDPDAFVLRLLYERLGRRRLPWPGGNREHGPVDGVRLALRQLSPRQRALLVLNYYEELTVVETGDLLALSHVAVRQQLQVALTRLQEELGRSGRVRPEEVRLLLEEALPDAGADLSSRLADEAWSAAGVIGSRRRRTAVLVTFFLVVVAAFSAVVFSR